MDTNEQHNPDRLNQHVLRTLLLEGKSHPLILKAVTKYVTDGKNPETRAELISNIRRELNSNVKELAAEAALDRFVEDLSSQVRN